MYHKHNFLEILWLFNIYLPYETIYSILVLLTSFFPTFWPLVDIH